MIFWGSGTIEQFLGKHNFVQIILCSFLSGHISIVGNLEGLWVGDILNLMYLYPAIFIAYYIFNALIRIPAINWIFVHTTMTHFPFWGRYREPNTKLKNIAVRNKNISNKSIQNQTCSKNMKA